MRIAVVGTGIAGLAAARALHRRHDIDVFEAEGRIGGHTNTVAVREGARELGIDTGFIVFNEHNYPLLARLFAELGVESRPSSMSFSVRCERSGLEYNGSSLSQLFCQRRNLLRPAHWAMIRDILRFHDIARAALGEGLDDSVSVADFAGRAGLGRAFTDYYLVPLGASLWSCSGEHFRRFPMRFVIEFLDNHCMLQVSDRPVWRTVAGGSSRYLGPLTAAFRERIRTATPVRALRRRAGAVELTTAAGETHRYDEVVLATHADQALRLLADADATERELLGAFPYTDNEVVLHTDTGVLPRRRAAWASWNYRIPAADRQRVAVTYNMNMLQGLDAAKTYCVSLNQSEAIAPVTVIARFDYAHPAFGPHRAEAQGRHGELIRRGGVSCCGAYWGYGFHEDGLRSAAAVTAAFDQELAA